MIAPLYSLLTVANFVDDRDEDLLFRIAWLRVSHHMTLMCGYGDE